MTSDRIPDWWDTTVTIYNKYENPVTSLVTWYRTVVKNCFWKYAGEKVVVGQTVLQTNNTICRIAKNSKFIEKYLWEQLTNENKGRKFTLGPGDIIVKGNVNDTINEYVSGQRSTDLLDKYKAKQGCIVIEDIALNDGTSRCVKHYLVRGV